MSAIWNGIQGFLGDVLSFFYGLVPNFGIAIILLTVSVGLLLFRLTLKQTRSMRAMQAIQPEIKRIQRELKNDKQAQQAAMMELYKERGVNPAAGCLPLILQMPIWFALFSVLRSFGSGELTERLKWVTEGSELYERVASGGSLDFLWMDLTRSPSAVLSGTLPDGTAAATSGLVPFIPYAILILIVVFTAYWQSKQTMARSDQNNSQPQPGQAVMKIFPFFFGFISYSMPTGLVVYFAASQMFRIGQQGLIIRLDERADEEADRQAKLEKKNKNTQQSPAADPEDGPSEPSKPKRRPQGSKKKRGKKRRRY